MKLTCEESRRELSVPVFDRTYDEMSLVKHFKEEDEYNLWYVTSCRDSVATWLFRDQLEGKEVPFTMIGLHSRHVYKESVIEVFKVLVNLFGISEYITDILEVHNRDIIVTLSPNITSNFLKVSVLSLVGKLAIHINRDMFIKSRYEVQVKMIDDLLSRCYSYCKRDSMSNILKFMERMDEICGNDISYLLNVYPNKKYDSKRMSAYSAGLRVGVIDGIYACTSKDKGTTFYKLYPEFVNNF